jgi:hypothetical protein
MPIPISNYTVVKYSREITEISCQCETKDKDLFKFSLRVHMNFYISSDIVLYFLNKLKLKIFSSNEELMLRFLR